MSQLTFFATLGFPIDIYTNTARNKTFKDLKKDTQKGFYKPTKRHVTNLDTHYM